VSVTLHPRSGRWVARWCDPDGRQHQRTFNRKPDARRHEQEQVAERDRVKLEQWWAEHWDIREAEKRATASHDDGLWTEIVQQVGGFDPVGWYVYLLWSRKGDPAPLYVGRSRNILSRLGSHLGNSEKRPHIGWVSLIRCTSHADMAAREGALIRKLRPPWNKDIPTAGAPRMSRKTSIYLSDDRLAEIEASGKTIPELIDLGLEYLAAQSDKIPQAESGPSLRTSFTKPTRDDCKHPKARRAKGLCMACGTYVGDS
jgi:hypothetical protein